MRSICGVLIEIIFLQNVSVQATISAWQSSQESSLGEEKMNIKSLKCVIGILTAVLLTFCAAASGSDFSSNGNDRKGKYIYRKNCRVCHDGSSASTLSPNSKTQAQWTRTFERHERLACADEWNNQSPAELNDVFSYLYVHAYDSVQPASCK